MQNNNVRKIVNVRLSKTLVGALPYGTVWVDEPSSFVVSWSGELQTRGKMRENETCGGKSRCVAEIL